MRRLAIWLTVLLALIGAAFNQAARSQQVHFISGFNATPFTGSIYALQTSTVTAAIAANVMTVSGIIGTGNLAVGDKIYGGPANGALIVPGGTGTGTTGTYFLNGSFTAASGPVTLKGDRRIDYPHFLDAIGLMKAPANTFDGNMLTGTALPHHNAMPICNAATGWLNVSASGGWVCTGGRAREATGVAGQNFAAITSLTAVMGGLDQQAGGFQTVLNPKSSGIYKITMEGWVNIGAAQTMTSQLYWGTGTAPASGAAVPVGAHAVGKPKLYLAAAGTSRQNTKLLAFATVSGCPCWVDVSNLVTGGTGAFDAPIVVATEQ